MAFSIVAAALAVPSPCAAATPKVDIPAGRLAAALSILGRQANIDILFSDELVGDRQSPAVSGRVGVGEALTRLLAGSGLTYQTTDGAYVVARVPEAAAAAEPDEAIPEILIIGRRVQNGDIRRTADDVQPYQVYSRRDVQRAHSSNIDAFARSRLPANAQIAAPSQIGSDTRSEINLRGLGADQTLILVDGRRLPNLPNPPFSFNQPDVNGIPVEMIDRIEVLTATAGGIYGTGATSGAINIVLQNDFRGAEISATTGITTRGDAFEYRLFGRLGFTPNGGRTTVMLAAARSRDEAVKAGSRDYLDRAAKRRFANNPDGVLASAPYPIGNGINIIGAGPLTLDPEFGGTALGATFTTLPLGLDGDVAKRNALLVANAGTLNLDLAPGFDGDSVSVQGAPVVRSILLNARHDFGGGVEAVFDLIDTRNVGRRRSPAYVSSYYPIAPNQRINPFQQTIYLAIPVESFGGSESRTVNTMRRMTAGLTIPLPGRWRAIAEVGTGSAKVSNVVSQGSPTADLFNALYNGVTAPGRPALDPLGDWEQFKAGLAAYSVVRTSTSGQSEKFRNLTLRLAGPVATLPGGPATLTLLGEDRRDTVAPTKAEFFFSDIPITLNLPRVAQRVRSLYGEARLPLTDDDTRLLSKLEVQLALRRDWTRATLPGAATFFETDPPAFAKTSGTTMYTAGAKASPSVGVMLRASVATGALPPVTSQIGARQFTGSNGTPDAKRGGRIVGSEAVTTFVSGGSPDLKPERAQSVSFGAILTPFGDIGPRLSLDFTRIAKRNEIVPFPVSTSDLVADDTAFPGRVTRAALSDADRAAGFTAGPVTRLDTTSINLGRTRIDSIDLAYDQIVPAGRGGEFTVYLRATWEPTYRQKRSDNAPSIERVGYRDGPLEWRGNGGVDWTRDRLTLGINGQFYSRYRVTSVTRAAAAEAPIIADQGARYIPSQAYFDLVGSYRFASPAMGAELRWAVINLFDHRPPSVVDSTGPGHSFYGDPRRRRVQLTLSVRR